MKLKTIVIVLTLLMMCGKTFAQYTNLRFENLSTIDGLSSSTCVDIFQDREGFIWFATIDGLNKYDGYDFTIFRSLIDDPYSISSNRISSITEDNVGTLWVGTGNGLNAFDKNAEKFVRISHDLTNPSSIGSDFIYQLLFDVKRNLLWATTKDGVSALSLNNISISDPESLKFQRYHSVKNNPLTLDHNEATSIAQDIDNKIWVVTAGNNLNVFDAYQNKFVQVPVTVNNPYHMDHIPKSFLIDKEGNFWIGNNLAGLTYWDRKKNAFSVKRLVEKTTPIFQIFQDKSGVIWCATDGDGIYFIDKDKGVTDHIVNNPSNPYSLSNNQPSNILEDRNGIFWIATYNTGVNKLIRARSAFEYYYHQPDNTNSLSHKIAQSVLEDNDGHIWIGTDGGGLNLFDEKKNTFKHFKHDPGNPASISGNKIINMCPSYRGLWICTWQGGICLLNTATGKFKSYKHNPSDPFSLSQNSIWCALEDGEHRLWAGTQSTGLNMFDPTTEKFHHFTSNPQDSSTLSNNFVLSLLIDSRNRLLVGTAIGINVTDLTSNTTVTDKLNFRRIKGASLIGNRINSLLEDHQGNIWVGSDLGLITLTPELQLHRTYTTKDGLPNNLITGVQQDNQHNIWVTTKSGLSQLDPHTHKFKNYNTHDGLQGMEFQSKSIDKMKDGRIIIGGLNGFNIFDPAMVLADTVPPRLILTRFSLFNKYVKPKDTVNNRVVFTDAIAETKSIELYHNENHISFEFLALNYKNPEKNKYAFRMVGLDKDWNYVGNKRNTSYTNLAPGDYRFEVMASQDGTWQDNNRISLAITISSPPWETWWAFVIYVILIGLIIWVILKYYTQRVRDEREHELDQMKLTFFTNVSHEFRTPLTLILNPIEKILSSYANPEEVKNSAFIIQRSARRLMSLVNQLLDFRKTDLGKAPLQTVPGDILKFSRDIFFLFNDMAEIKKINFRFESSVETIPASFDPDKVEKILTNILSNAIKFTEPGGAITLSVNKVPNPAKLFSKGSKDHVEFKIKDTGTGLKPDQLKHVFEPFFHVDNSKTGTGIGLHFTRSLVELHQGVITVDSEFEKGTTFTISLPLHPKRTKSDTSNTHSLDKYAFDSIAIQSIEYELSINNETEDNDNSEPEQAEELKPVVLIVEDNRELRLHLKNELRNQFKVREATNGAEGFEKVMKYFPDVVISDIMMPQMDGFELCRKIKTDIETSHIPVVLLTARSLEEDKIEGYRTGADEYLAKPFNIHVLRARLKNLLEARERLKKKFMSSSNLLAAKEVTTNSMDEAFLDKATKVVLENISDPDFSLDEFLEKLAVSRSYFSRKINSITGQNPSNFIRTIRLKYAASLLVQDQYTIKEIGFMAGFNSPAYFSKTFKELFGKTPQEYRENPGPAITNSTQTP